METTMTQERLLITENKEQVQGLRQEAMHNVHKLDKAYQYEQFTSKNELQKLVNELPQYRVNTMKQNKKIRDLMEVGVVPPTPTEILQREEALRDALGCFKFARFNGGWEVDSDAVEAAADRFRKYITEDYQFTLYNNQQKMARILNETPMGQNSRERNWTSNEFVKWNGRLGQWEPNTSTLFMGPDHFKY